MRPEKIPRRAPDQLPAIIESLLFVAEEPQEIGTLSKTLNTPRQGIEHAIEALIESTADRGIYVQRHGDRVQLSTTPEAAPYIEQFLEVEHGRLSRASLETLAIIAYRQPATRGTVESVRGVNSDHSVATLLARELIEDVGRVPGPGRAVLFGTTLRFLEYFGLQKPEDLPPLPEVEQDEGAEVPEEPPAKASTNEDSAESPNEAESDTDELPAEPLNEAEPELSVIEP